MHTEAFLMERDAAHGMAAQAEELAQELIPAGFTDVRVETETPSGGPCSSSEQSGTRPAGRETFGRGGQSAAWRMRHG
jgi:hypothetical protein